MKKAFRSTVLAGICVVGFSVSAPGPAYAILGVGDIVFDPTSFAQLIKQYAQDVQAFVLQNKQYFTQVQEFALQIQQFATEVQMFINWVHDPTLGAALGLLTVAGLGTYLPVNPMALLGVVNGLSSMGTTGFSLGGLAGIGGQLSAFASQAWGTNHIYSPTDNSWDSQQLIAGAASIAGTQGVAATTNLALQQHLAAQPALRDHLMGASSPKDVQDATAEVDLETTWELNQIGQMTTGQLMYEAQRDSREQRDNEAFVQSIDNWLVASGTGLQ